MYLESSLKDLPQLSGQSRNLEHAVETRRSLLNFFRTRDCVALVRPHKQESMLLQLQSLGAGVIEPAFAAGVQLIRSKVLLNCRQKIVQGLRMLRSKREELPRRKHGNVPL